MAWWQIWKDNNNTSIKQSGNPKLELVWSQNPGCYERHLQRMCQNALFPPASRVVTQREIDSARLLDVSDAERLREKVRLLIETKVSGNNAMEISIVVDVVKKIDKLLDRVAAIGGQGGDDIAKSLTSLRNASIGSWRKCLQDMGNTQALHALDEAERFVEENMERFRNGFNAQMSKLDLPEDIVPALLSENAHAISVVLKLMGNESDTRENLCVAGIRLLSENLHANPPVPQLEEKLRVLGAPEGLIRKLLSK